MNNQEDLTNNSWWVRGQGAHGETLILEPAARRKNKPTELKELSWVKQKQQESLENKRLQNITKVLSECQVILFQFLITLSGAQYTVVKTLACHHCN